MENPYAAPVGDGKRSTAHAKVVTVAISLIVVSLLDIVLNGLAVANMYRLALDPELDDQGRRTFLSYATYNLIHAAYAVPVFAGAISMARMKSYLFSVTAVWMAVIPFMAPCFVLSVPFGIWGILVLRNPDIRAAFADNRST
jgi:hypothetical protein